MCDLREDPLNVKNFRRLIIYLLIGVLALSCDAPHLNPLDPSNSDSQYGRLSGSVTNSSSQPILNVRIIWKNQNVMAISDSLGHYSFSNLELKDGWLTFEKNDYQSDSLYVQWNSRKNIAVNVKQLYRNVGILDGYAYTSSTPAQPLSNVQVIWKNQNILAITNSSGYFKFDGLLMNDGIVYYAKDGFVKDSAAVQWNKRTSVTLDIKYLKFSSGSIYGYVRSRSGNLISGASVTLKSTGIAVQTGANGYYRIDNVPHNPDSLLFQADGYSSSTLAVSWTNNSENTEVDASLNANPKLNDVRIYSSIVNDYTSTKATLYVQAKVSDEDVGDVDSVYVSCADLNIQKLPLAYNFETGYFETSINEGSSLLSSIENAIGKMFSIIVRDNQGKFFNVGSSFLKRIIRDQVNFYSPANGQTDQKNPTLKWIKFQPGFNFTYMVQVYTVGALQQLVWQKSNISSADIQVVVNTNLISGLNYYWVIWCIDDYQNRSRSKPATFVVQ